MKTNHIYQGDCREVMKTFPDKSIDLVLTDPPYGINENAFRVANRGKLAKTKDYGEFHWDKKRIEKVYFDEMFRISKNQIIFGGNYYIDYLYPTKCFLVWDKDNFTNDFADCELAWTSFKTAARIFKWRWSGMLQENMSNKELREHPTQKPLALFDWIVRNYSEPYDLILDPFMGSGVTLEACKLLHRNYIGIEINPDYCKIAEERLRQEVFDFPLNLR